jgi:opacity protein-like surface antigen
MKNGFGVLLLLLLSLSVASAQTQFDLNVGFGSAWDSANGGGLENFNSPNALFPCNPNSGDPNCQANPSLGGFFLGFGGDLMFNDNKYGVGTQFNFQPPKSDYGPLQYRQSFWDVNGIYQPIVKKRASLQLQGGIGLARTSFAISQNQCLGTAVCSNFTQPFGASNHFQLHVGVGVQFFLTDHIFLRPQFDLHYVPSFTDQFGRNAVPEATVWLGYSLGRQP